MMRYFWNRSLLFSLFFILTVPVYGIDVLKHVIDSATVGYMTSPDNRKVRYAHWNPKGAEKPFTIVIFQGRASFIEKHSEFIQDLQKRGYEVVTFDWAGQGLSTRLIKHSQKGHIDTYDTFLKDAHQIITEVVKPSSHKPIILFGSSMGGHIALRYMAEHPGIVRGLVLESPMMDIPTKPFPRWLAKIMMTAGTFLGFGESYAPSYGDFDPYKETFERAKNTHDKKRFLRQRQYTIDYPSHVVGGPTIGWVKATFDSLDALANNRELKKIQEPVLFLNAEKDTAVVNGNDKEACDQLPKCKLITYKGSKHHILVELDKIRNKFWKDFDQFISHFSKKNRKLMAQGSY